AGKSFCPRVSSRRNDRHSRVRVRNRQRCDLVRQAMVGRRQVRHRWRRLWPGDRRHLWLAVAALTLGIIGGIAPESTIEYYRTIIALHRERTGGQYPPILINSIDLKKMLALVAEQRFPELITYLVAEIRKLAAGGATIGLFASNTPHIVFDELRSQSPIPLVSIVEATF